MTAWYKRIHTPIVSEGERVSRPNIRHQKRRREGADLGADRVPLELSFGCTGPSPRVVLDS